MQLARSIMVLIDTPERVFLYVTMENYVYETWVRLYCSLFNKTKEEMLQLYIARDDIRKNQGTDQ